MRRASAAGLAMRVLPALCFGFALLVSGCGSPRRPDASPSEPLPEIAAAALADSLRGALVHHYEVPATSQKDVYAAPAQRDSVAGYVVRISVPYEMVKKHTIPHEWMREQLLDDGWTIDMEANRPDGASYRAFRGPALITVEATWEDTQPPANVPDWYALTVGIPSRAVGR